MIRALSLMFKSMCLASAAIAAWILVSLLWRSL